MSHLQRPPETRNEFKERLDMMLAPRSMIRNGRVEKMMLIGDTTELTRMKLILQAVARRTSSYLQAWDECKTPNEKLALVGKVVRYPEDYNPSADAIQAAATKVTTI